MPLSERVRAFLADPPLGSKTRAAQEFGVDISLTSQRLAMSGEERLGRLAAMAAWVMAIRGARRRS
jgi:hypothetical protein